VKSTPEEELLLKKLRSAAPGDAAAVLATQPANAALIPHLLALWTPGSPLADSMLDLLTRSLACATSSELSQLEERPVSRKPRPVKVDGRGG